MKIDRLLGILTILMQCGKVTAPELARRFEVSRRTIQRDIDDICKAGIPVVTLQGGGGGISIAEGFKLDKSILTVDELNHIITGLGSIGSVTDSAKIERLIAKLSPRKQGIVSMQDRILIDLSSHYKTSLSEKISLIQSAIEKNRLVSFRYYSPKGSEVRLAEPYFIAFKWSSWYLFGYCLDKQDFRLFKLNRLWELEVPERTFAPRDIPPEKSDIGDFLNDTNKVTVLFDKSAEYQLVEEYGPESYKELEDGRLQLTVGYTNREYVVKWILGFGEKAKVAEPAELAAEIEETAKKIVANYRHDI
jgi:predicted DNA-binding transcriptional regulator YafY